jgi:hypothetical protein
MAYVADNGLWRRWDLWRWLASATLVTVIPAAAVCAMVALATSQPGHQMVNRAAKADALVSSSMLEMKRGVQASWDQFFDYRQGGEPQSSRRIVAALPSGEKIAAGPDLKARFVEEFE